MSHKLLASLVAAITLGAFADNVVYVATNGSNANDGSESHPYASLDVAITALGTDGGTVIVKSGTYAFSSSTAPAELQSDADIAGATCIRITTPVAIVGATGNPADVTFKRDNAAGSARVFMLDHADAKLQYVTVQDGKFTDGYRNGGNVLIGNNGGTVEDCILKDGNAGNANSTTRGGGNIALLAGRCSRCTITGGAISHYRMIGLNVMAAGSSIVENCLITKGRCTSAHEAAADEGAVALKDSSKLINCTVVKNSANRFSGVNILSGNARAINCIIYGNTVTYESDARGNANDGWANGVSKNNSNLGCYVNCATDLDTSVYPQLNSTCFTIESIDFLDAENEDWRPHVNSVSRDAGSDYATSGATSTTDLGGATRVQGSDVDVGCYELAPAFHLRASADTTLLVVGSAPTAHFTAVPGDAVGTVTFTWSFGDGSAALVTTETSAEHTYTTPGSYTVSVTATCEAGEATYVFPQSFVVVDFDITFSRSAEIALVGQEVTFSAEATAAVPIQYTWTFGDGTSVQTDEGLVTHTYSTAGQFEVSVTANGGSAGEVSFAFEELLYVLPADVYVKSNGSGTFPFATWDAAAKSLDAVWKYLADGITVHVAPGTYQTKDWQPVVSNAVTIVGEGATPNDVVFHNGWANFNSGTRNLVMRNENALVANVTLNGGFANYAKGGNLLLESGVVSNCVLTSGGCNSSGGSGGAAYVSGGLLTHCVITNSYLGNRGNGITVYLENGRVSNCLITGNRRSWSGSRNAFSLVYAAGGVIDNCTIADCWILKNNPNKPLQMGTASDKAVNIGENAKAYNLAIADIRWDIEPGDGEDREDLLAEAGTPQRWAGTAASFVNCATDDAAAINATCSVGTTATMFNDYANGDLTPGPALKNKGGAVEGYAFPSVDLAGLPRLNHAVDVGCYEKQPVRGMSIICR